MAKARVDEFAQIGYISVSEAAAGTTAFNGISVFSNILTPKGMLIHKILYRVSPAATVLMTTDNDSIEFGMAGSDDVSPLSLDDPQLYDYNAIYRRDLGTAGSGIYVSSINERDFTSLPGGGLLLPADRIFAFIVGNGTATVITLTLRFYFTIIDLTAQQYIELAQSLRVLK